MSDEKEFDEIFRNKFEEQAFPFDEGNWDEAEELIEKQRRKEKRRRRFIFFFFGLIAGIGITLPFFYSLNESVAENKKTGENKIENTEIEKTGSPSSKSDTNNLNRIETNSSIDSLEKNQKNQNQTEEYYNQKTSKELSNKVNDNKNSSTSNQKNNLSLQKFDDKKSNVTKNNSNSDSQETKSNQEKNDSKNQNTIATNSIDKNDETKNDLKSDETKQELNNEKTSENLKDKTNPKTETNPLTILENESLIADRMDTSELKKNDSLPETNKDSSLVKNDSLIIPTITPLILPPAFEKNGYWNILSGVIYHKGWEYHDTTDGKGFTPTIGIRYEYCIKPKISVSAQLNYIQSGKMNYNYKSVISSQPDFGRNDSVVKYSLKRIHSINLPVSFNYHLNDKNSIGLGASFSYLLFSNSNITTSRINNTGEQIISNKTGKNYYQGFNQMDIALNLSYRRKLNSKLDLLLDVNYGLLDQKDNSYFTNANDFFERNIFVRGVLSFKIFNQ